MIKCHLLDFRILRILSKVPVDWRTSVSGQHSRFRIGQQPRRQLIVRFWSLVILQLSARILTRASLVRASSTPTVLCTSTKQEKFFSQSLSDLWRTSAPRAPPPPTSTYPDHQREEMQSYHFHHQQIWLSSPASYVGSPQAGL